MEDEDGDMDEEGKTENLTTFIESLDRKRKRGEDCGYSEKLKRRAAREKTEAYAENEFNVNTRDPEGTMRKLALQDLVGAIQDEAGFTGLKKKITALENGGNMSTYKEPLSAPLPRRIQDRLNRQAAYEETKKEVTKWQPIVKQNREADRLAFPLNAPAQHQPSNASLTSAFEATTALEKDVKNILEESGLKEKDLKEFEELELNKLSVEEVDARRKELRRMRELMFREEIKSRRISKIKSKTYRKVKKKEREKFQDRMNSLAVEAGLVDAREEQLKQEAQRAQERMTLKHKNTGKWARRALKQGRQDEDSRQAIVEQLERHEKLKRKIHDLGSGEDSEVDLNSEYSDLDESADVEIIKQRAVQELDELEGRFEEEDIREEEGGERKKGVFAMKFMQVALERKQVETEAVLNNFRAELEAEEGISDEEDSVEPRNEKPKDKVMNVCNNPGRIIFGVGSSKALGNGERPDQPLDPDHTPSRKSGQCKQAVTVRVTGPISLEQKLETLTTGPSTANDDKQFDDPTITAAESDDEEGNPWMQHDTTHVRTSSRKDNRGVGESSSKSDKLVSKLKSIRKAEEVEAEISLDTLLTLEAAQQAAQPKKRNSKEKTTEDVASEAEEDDVDVMENLELVHAKNPLAFTQRDLVARAFANDNVIKEFEEEKKAAIDEDAPKKEDLTLPGWGTWGGKGIKEKKNVVVKDPTPGNGVDANKRKDAKLKHVIINEKKNKKVTKYMATKLPHPFQTAQQYEQSLRHPLGREWNTGEVHQKLVVPRVTTKLGTVIDPLTAPFK